MKLALIFGGNSPEHEISLRSAKNIFHALDKNKYDIRLIGVDHQGHWFLFDNSFFANAPTRVIANDNPLALLPGQRRLLKLKDQSCLDIDVAFPIIHGKYGEDGALQGLLTQCGIPFVGADVLGSAIGMDKDVMHNLLRQANIQVTTSMTVYCDQYQKQDIVKQIGFPCFIKPANTGSSIGVYKANDEAQLDSYLTKAFRYDHKVIIEKEIVGRELELAVLDNDDTTVSVAGEIVVHDDFYTYSAKYLNANAAELIIPAQLEPEVLARLQAIAAKAFKVLQCKTYARIDFFLTAENEIYLNEINTIPGFTNISMYPVLMAQQGIAYPDLLDQLISSALNYFDEKQSLKTFYEE